MNADHFLLNGIRTSQHNTSKTKSTKPLSNISFLLFFISTNCSSSSLATQKGLFLVLNISYTILSLPTKVEHCYHQSPATILKRKKVKRGLPIASRLKVRGLCVAYKLLQRMNLSCLCYLTSYYTCWLHKCWPNVLHAPPTHAFICSAPCIGMPFALSLDVKIPYSLTVIIVEVPPFLIQAPLKVTHTCPVAFNTLCFTTETCLPICIWCLHLSLGIFAIWGINSVPTSRDC